MNVDKHDLRESEDDLLNDSYSFMCHKGGAFGIEHAGAVKCFDYCPFCGDQIDLQKILSPEQAYKKDRKMIEEIKNDA